MKKSIYIWLLCLGGLFLSQQSIAQRGHGHNNKGHYNSKSYQKSQKKYHKQRAKAYKHYQKRSYSKAHNSRGYSRNNRDHYNTRSYHNSRRIVRAPRSHRSYRGAPWANRHHYNYHRHVYFPDYHAFYDARRHGYVYRNRGRWIFSQAVPSFMVGLNWNNVRLQYLQGVPVTSYPQNYYDTYSNRYPAVSFNLNLNL